MRPPDHAAECVACMEAGLAPSAKAYAPPQPVLGLAAHPVQWWQETHVPLAATPPQGKRVADADERHGTACLGLCAEPLAGGRPAPARERRPPGAGAIEVAQVLDTRDGAGAQGPLVCANRNTPTQGACYEAFPPE